MNFESWLKANGYDAEKLSDGNRKHLEASWKAETGQLVAPAPAPVPKAESFDETMKAIEAESQRCQYIQERTEAACKANIRNPEKIAELRTLCESAIADKKTDVRAFDLALLRAERTLGPIIMGPRPQQQVDNDVLEVAVAQAVGIRSLDKQYSDQVLQAAHTRFRRGIGLKELLMVAAERNNGYRGSMSDEQALCRAAFGPNRYEGMGADAGPSSINVPGILSNVANKSLEAGFLYAEQAWREVARIRPLRDFKTASMYRLGANAKFQKVAPDGQIKHGTLSEYSYDVKADQYGIMVGVSRVDIINDDLGAFAGVSDEIGRGGADSINDVFWNDVFIANLSTLFPTDDSNDNYISGATTPLSLAGLNLADVKLRLQTKADGTPLGLMGAVLLTPAALSNTAQQLMGTQGLVVGTTPASGPNLNVFAGRYRPVSTVFLDATSQIEWYLLADPRAAAVIQIGFLNGVDRPTIQSSEFDFDRLGLAMRGYFDFGVNVMEYRAGVRSKGAA